MSRELELDEITRRGRIVKRQNANLPGADAPLSNIRRALVPAYIRGIPPKTRESELSVSKPQDHPAWAGAA